MDALETILTRRSCRTYTDKEVSDDIIEKLLRAGMYAPSAHNSQPWEFLVLRDSDKKRLHPGRESTGICWIVHRSESS